MVKHRAGLEHVRHTGEWIPELRRKTLAARWFAPWWYSEGLRIHRRWITTRDCGLDNYVRLLACFMSLFFMVLHHRTRRHLLGPVSIATTFLRRVLYVFVHSFFFIANTTQRLLFFLFPWHICIPF